MAHVVTGNLGTSAEAWHQPGVRGTKAAEVDRLLQADTFAHGLQMPVKQIVTIQLLAHPLGEDKVVRLAQFLVACPHCPYRAENNSVFVVRHWSLAGIRFYVGEFIVVNALVHDDASAKNVLHLSARTSPGRMRRRQSKS